MIRRKCIGWSVLAVMLLTMVFPCAAFAEAEEEVPVFISDSMMEIDCGDTETIKLQLSDKSLEIYFHSMNMQVASVNAAGVVTAHMPGETTIQVLSSHEVIDECIVTVNEVNAVQPWIYSESVTPEAVVEVVEEPVKEEVKHYHYYQGDSKWKFGEETRKKACVLTSMAMILKNLGEDITPRKLYRLNRSTGMGFKRSLMSLGRNYSAALPYDSEYIKGYDIIGGRTFINNPRKNYESAVKEALEMHPEGVLCYFINGHGKHAIVATEVDENGRIYYNDPGRKSARGEHVTFKNTWCRYSHKMGYGSFAYFMAVN